MCIDIIQIGLLGLQVIWTSGATDALKNARSDKKIMQAVDNHFQEILDMLIDVTTKELTKIERTKFETLITIHLHQRDIFHALVKYDTKCMQKKKTFLATIILNESVHGLELTSYCEY